VRIAACQLLTSISVTCRRSNCPSWLPPGAGLSEGLHRRVGGRPRPLSSSGCGNPARRGRHTGRPSSSAA